MRSVLLGRLTLQVLSCTRTSCGLSGRPSCAQKVPGHTHIHQSFRGSLLVRYSQVSSEKFTLIYTLPYIGPLRALSRLKILQTGITVLALPPIYVLYFMGDVSSSLVYYSTGVALFAGAMLYTASHFFRRVVGRMYLDPAQKTLKVSHLTFWGKRHDLYLPVSDIMTISDTGDSVRETILRLKTHSNTHTLLISTYYGRVVDQAGFKRVFGRFT